MQGYNCIAVFNEDADRWLMCLRKKDPYKGLLNLVGGKIEPDEEHLSAAYRELGVNADVEPVMTLCFMSLAVIPEVKLTDMGLFDVTQFRFIPLEADGAAQPA